jgi:hypothetical protein
MKEFPPLPPLNWLGLPIRPGEGYGGRAENIPKTFGRKQGQAGEMLIPGAKDKTRETSRGDRKSKSGPPTLIQLPDLGLQQHPHAVITESHLAEIWRVNSPR